MKLQLDIILECWNECEHDGCSYFTDDSALLVIGRFLNIAPCVPVLLLVEQVILHSRAKCAVRKDCLWYLTLMVFFLFALQLDLDVILLMGDSALANDIPSCCCSFLSVYRPSTVTLLPFRQGREGDKVMLPLLKPRSFSAAVEVSPVVDLRQNVLSLKILMWLWAAESEINPLTKYNRKCISFKMFCRCCFCYKYIKGCS